MIYLTGTKGEVLKFLVDNKQDPALYYKNMTGVEQKEGVTIWHVVTTVCRSCKVKNRGFVPKGTDLKNLECPTCRQMTAEA